MYLSFSLFSKGGLFHFTKAVWGEVNRRSILRKPEFHIYVFDWSGCYFSDAVDNINTHADGDIGHDNEVKVYNAFTDLIDHILGETDESEDLEGSKNIHIL